MALSDRQVNNLLAAARVASNTDITSAANMANQCDQRHVPLNFCVSSSLSAAATYRFVGYVADRPYKVISARLISPAVITASATSYVSVNVVANNDANGADTVLAQLLVNTSNVTTFSSQALTVQSTNTIASAQQVDLLLGFVAGGQKFDSGMGAGAIGLYTVDLVVQEV